MCVKCRDRLHIYLVNSFCQNTCSFLCSQSLSESLLRPNTAPSLGLYIDTGKPTKAAKRYQLAMGSFSGYHHLLLWSFGTFYFCFAVGCRDVWQRQACHVQTGIEAIRDDGTSCTSTSRASLLDQIVNPSQPTEERSPQAWRRHSDSAPEILCCQRRSTCPCSSQLLLSGQRVASPSGYTRTNKSARGREARRTRKSCTE